ncbi:MAG: CheR family methyltransferase [Granulosicoccus sp.]
MIAIAYASEATVPFDQNILHELNSAAVKENRRLGLTGYLSLKNSRFFQYLEGPENAVNEIMEQIRNDPRHNILRTFELGSVERRRFSQWQMLNIHGSEDVGIRVQDLFDEVIDPALDDTFNEEETSRILLEIIDKLSQLLRSNHEKALVNDTEGVDIGEASPFVVAFGASAGGLYPLQSIIRSLKPDLDAAFIVIQHLSPDSETLMDMILQRETSMEVRTAAMGIKLRAGCVYVIPPGENLEVSNGKFDLSKQQRSSKGPQFPIDIGFRSIAREYGDRAVGIILSGTGTDGSRGAKILNEAGGVVLAQTPDSAEFDGMPNVIIETGMVHQILAPPEIAEFINNLSGDYVHDSLALWPARRAVYVSEVVTLLQDNDVDFSQYKSETLFRRIERRRVLASIPTSEKYIEFIRSSEKERRELRDDILITVTSFFRDPDAWDKLKETIVPLIADDWNEGDTFRVWVSACSTGEEAYTVGIILTELLEKLDKQIKFKIYATDIERKALEHASTGCYSDRALAQVSPERRQRFFTRSIEGYTISTEIRESVIFAPHNFIKNAPFTRMHLVTCRNVLIYMQPELQQTAIKKLHSALNINGILFLGPSETLGSLQSEFYPLQREWNQYKKLRDLRVPLHLSMEQLSDASLDYPEPLAIKPVQLKNETKSSGLIGLSLDALSQHSRNTNVLIDTARSVMLVVSDPSGLLQVNLGAPTLDLTKMVPEGLRGSLSFAIARAFKEHTPVCHKQVACVPSGQGERHVNIEVAPHVSAGEKEAFYALVIFSSAESGATLASSENDTDHAEVKRLQYELVETRKVLEAAINDLESSDNEHRTANEQLMAANEELQSTNEELQSVNEELYTVNHEYQTKIHELSDLNKDFEDLFDSTRLGVIILDSDLCIRRFTEYATRTVSLLPSDIGRPFVDLAHTLNYKNLIDDLRRVLSTGKTISREISRNKVDQLQVGLHPYRAGTGLARGVIVMFRDVKKTSSRAPALEDLDTAH